jgi:hypothetical protein
MQLQCRPVKRLRQNLEDRENGLLDRRSFAARKHLRKCARASYNENDVHGQEFAGVLSGMTTQVWRASRKHMGNDLNLGAKVDGR